MDSAALCRHASCFILYLTITLLYFVTYILQITSNSVDHKKFVALFQWVSVFYWILVFTSNMLLAYIFYDILSVQI